MAMTIEQKRALAIASARARAAGENVAVPEQFGMEDYGYKPPQQTAQDRYSQTAQGQSFGQNLAAGAGGMAYGLGYLGPKSLVGMDSPGEVADWKQSMAGLGGTSGGMVGSVLGGAGVGVPMMMMPGGQTLPGAALAGAGMGAITPAESAGERMQNIGRGGAGGGLGQYGGRLLNSRVAQRLQARQAELLAAQSRNAPIDQTLEAAINAGLKVPPATVNPTLANRLRESVAGKAATQQAISTKNVDVINAMARRAAGLQPNEPITPETLDAARGVLAAPYREVEALPARPTLQATSPVMPWTAPQQAQQGFDPADILTRIRQAKAESKMAWRRHEGMSGQTPETLANAKAATAAYKKLEDDLELYAMQHGDASLVDRVRKARAALAKNFAVEDALIEGGGSIDARKLAALSQRQIPLTGELKVLGDFANNFPKNVQPEKVIGSPGVSKVAASLGTLLAGGGMASPLGPGGAMLGALPFVAPWIAERSALSAGAQRALIPRYQPSLTQNLLARGLNSPYGALAERTLPANALLSYDMQE